VHRAIAYLYSSFPRRTGPQCTVGADIHTLQYKSRITGIAVQRLRVHLRDGHVVEEGLQRRTQRLLSLKGRHAHTHTRIHTPAIVARHKDTHAPRHAARRLS
jgi:hypothetical protein